MMLYYGAMTISIFTFLLHISVASTFHSLVDHISALCFYSKLN